MAEKEAGAMLWDEFLNSDYHDGRSKGKSEDRLDKPGWLASWCDEHGLAYPGDPSPDELAALKDLRGKMFRMVRKIASGAALSADDLETLNRTMAGGSVVHLLRSSDEGWRLETAPAAPDWRSVLAVIALSFAKTLTEGEASRIRICDNPDCLWVYYDRTRNRSKRYCEDRSCGNLMKVRRFRASRKRKQ
jgi:predicted RNA-binding Zn ribbon-like protein